MASELAIYYTPMHFMWGVKSGATPAPIVQMLVNFPLFFKVIAVPPLQCVT